MKNSYCYFENRQCKYYPCHENMENLNCMFCFCPLYRMESCPGNPVWIDGKDGKIKDCSACTFPHKAESYDTIMKLL